MIELNKIYNEDCLEGMKRIQDKSVDMIFCDLPYGTTASQWDSIIPFEPLWEQYKRIIKDTGAIVLTASGGFTHKVISSNEQMYKYKWIWKKNRPTNFVNAKNRPMTIFEEVLVFSKANTANGSKVKMVYNPQGLVEVNTKVKKSKTKFGSVAGARKSHQEYVEQQYTNYPVDFLEFNTDSKQLHPTQKPVALVEYLIKTYTNEGETVLDNCMGSGTTAIACINTNRNFIGFELDENYYRIATERIEKELLSDG
jgi:site-specific DNA-methyltransferase (adenine-specific)